MKKRVTKRLRNLMRHLDAEQIAYMWADELPDGYKAANWRPHWLRDEKRGGVVILKGSKEWRRYQNASDYAHTFVERAARRFRVNTGVNPQPGESAVLDAIADRVRDRWPLLRAVWRYIYPRGDYMYWRDGILACNEDLARTAAELSQATNTELFYRSHVIHKITQELSRMR